MDLATNEKPSPLITVEGQDSHTIESHNSQRGAENNGHIDQILALAARGWPVLPCDADKHPLIAGGFKSASTDPDQIRAWWGAWPSAMVGIATGEVSGITVKDVDVKDGQPGMASLLSLVEKHGPLPDTLVAETRSGGFHYFFKFVNGSKCSAGKLAPGIDVRSNGGYIICPPSAGYKWINPGTEIAEASAWLKALLVPPVAAVPEPVTVVSVPRDGQQGDVIDRARKYVAALPPSIDHQGGHPALYRAACALVHGFELSEETALDLLREYNQRGDPDSDYQLRHKIRDAATKPHDKPRGYLLDARHELRDVEAEPPKREPGWKLNTPPAAQPTEAAIAEELATHTPLPMTLRWLDAHGTSGPRIWDSRRWAPSADRLPLPLQGEIRRSVARAIEQRRLTAKEAVHLESANGMRGIAALLQPWPEMQLRAEKLDPAGLIVTPAGVIDLHAPEDSSLLAHDPARQVTRCTNVDPMPGSEMWAVVENHLRACCTPEGFTALHRLLGSALIGRGPDRKLIWLSGAGADGKTTLMRILAAALGDYVTTLPAEVLAEGARGSHGHELASGLAGSRIALCAEVGKNLNWTMSKALAGGEITATKRAHGKKYTFDRPPLLVITANHPPEPPDEACADRILHIELRKPDEQDERLVEVLADGGPERDALAASCFAWLLTGCREYLAHGLGSVPRFRAKPSPLAQWLGNALECGEIVRGGGPTPLADLLPIVRLWEENSGLIPCAAREVSDFLAGRGLARRSNGKRGYSLTVPQSAAPKHTPLTRMGEIYHAALCGTGDDLAEVESMDEPTVVMGGGL